MYILVLKYRYVKIGISASSSSYYEFRSLRTSCALFLRILANQQNPMLKANVRIKNDYYETVLRSFLQFKH